AVRGFHPLARPRRAVHAAGVARLEAHARLHARARARDLQDRRALAADHRGRRRVRGPVGHAARLSRTGDLRRKQPGQRDAGSGHVPRARPGADRAAVHRPRGLVDRRRTGPDARDRPDHRARPDGHRPGRPRGRAAVLGGGAERAASDRVLLQLRDQRELFRIRARDRPGCRHVLAGAQGQRGFHQGFPDGVREGRGVRRDRRARRRVRRLPRRADDRRHLDRDHARGGQCLAAGADVQFRHVRAAVPV
ncbi:MAG: Phospholipid ABC transporter permease protein MlaE, partial [uncultured Lysobacter sp.]